MINSGNFVDFYSKIFSKLEARNGEKTHLGQVASHDNNDWENLKAKL